MARSPITPDVRAAQALEIISKLAACASELLLDDSPSTDPADWLPVADLAGQLQRRARLLAGLGRGG